MSYNDGAGQDETASGMADGMSMEEQTFLGGDDTGQMQPDSAFLDGSANDITLLNLYCARAKAPKGDNAEAKAEAEASWQPVRAWLASHNAEEVRAAAEQRGESGQTALHFACRNVPPVDVIDVFLSIAADTVQWPDSFGWLPIHYACASGSDPVVIHKLADAFPESKTATDRKGRTPLHFALGEKQASPDVIFLLSSSGAAGIPDGDGMLPLHFACAFGASEEVLYVLTDAFPDAITARDKKKRTPLHFALSNAGRKTVPAAVRLLLSLDRSIVNAMDGGLSPLRVLADYAGTVKNEDENRDEHRESVHRCLEHLLRAAPEPTADFFTALQSLPDWLSERAVVMAEVQNLLNEKIAQRFPTAVLMLDFYVMGMIIFFYSINVQQSLENRAEEDLRDTTVPKEERAIDLMMVFPLYLGAAYFTLREIIQVISLLSLKVFKLWLHDPSNYVNVAFVVLVFAWSFIMEKGLVEIRAFRIGASISVTLLWVKLLAYLRNMLIDFAVFVGGVFYVVRRLAAFLISLGVILMAFSQMFATVYRKSELCTNKVEQNLSDPTLLSEAICANNPKQEFCDIWSSFIHMYNMMLGQSSEEDFKSNGGGTISILFFIIFMFLVVILLANVLIAIVTDSYKVIQEKRAAIVFWTNRLDFVAEMDAISNGPWKSRLKKMLGLGATDDRKTGSQAMFGKELWKQLIELFEDDVDEGVFSLDFLMYFLLRAITAIFIIPCWIVLGLVTVGWLWPPQVREALFTSTVFKQVTDSQVEDDLRRTQVNILRQEVVGLKDELLQELALDRTQIVQMKSQLAEQKLEIAHEMVNVKRLVALLFERQSG